MKKMTQKHQLMAYVLNKEFGYVQKDIAKLMRVSQSTISNATKEVEYKIKYKALERKVKNLRNQVEELELIGEQMVERKPKQLAFTLYQDKFFEIHDRKEQIR